MRVLVVGVLAACLTTATVFWSRPVAQASPPATLVSAGEIKLGNDAGTVEVGARLESHWSNWNGTVALFAHREATPRQQLDFAGKQVLYPAFTYGALDAVAQAKLRSQVTSWAADARMTVEEEPRLAVFRARFLAERSTIAFVPESLTTVLGLDSAAAVQRLALVRVPE